MLGVKSHVGRMIHASPNAAAKKKEKETSECASTNSAANCFDLISRCLSTFQFNSLKRFFFFNYIFKEKKRPEIDVLLYNCFITQHIICKDPT